jgi:hypothetical protein
MNLENFDRIARQRSAQTTDHFFSLPTRFHWCSCGYAAQSEDHLDDHITYMARIGDEERHRPK